MQKPELIFKYKALSSKSDILHFLDIINHHRLFFPTVYQLNDPFEGYLSTIHPSVAGCSIHLSADEEHPIIISLKEEYHILALTDDCFSPQMWALYCQDYSGVCLCYKTSKTFHNVKTLEYKSQAAEIRPFNTENEKELRRLIKKRLLEKQIGWAYEHEWRIIERIRRNNADANNSSYITYEPDELVGIIIGHKMDDETKDFVLSTIRGDLPVFKTCPGSVTGQIHLLEYHYEIRYNGSVPEFIDTISQLKEAIQKKSGKND